MATPGTDQIYIQSLMEAYEAQAYSYGHDHLHSVSDYNGLTYILAGRGKTANEWMTCLAQQYDPYDVLVNESGHVPLSLGPSIGWAAPATR